MQNLQAPSRLANTDTDVMVVARARLTQAADALMATDAARLLAGDVAEAIQRDPLTAEQALQIFASLFARAIMVAAIEQLDDHGEYLQVDGRSYRRAEATPGQAMTLFGPVSFMRSRYRPTSGKGASIFPTEAILGLTEGSMTPAAAGLALWLTANLTARESAETWARLTGSGPAVSSLTGLAGEASRRFEADGGKITDELMAEEEIHPEAVAVLGCLDGVMLRMHAEEVNGKEIGAGWREASCGVAALLDAEGNMLQSVCLGRLPETGKTSLKAQLSRQLFHWLAQRPDLKLVVIADGARDNWTFLDALEPDVTVLDAWHAVQHLKVAADAAFGEGSPEAMAWFEKWRHILRHHPDGAFKVIDALRYLARKGVGIRIIARELGYFRSNRRRMDYRRLADAGYPIGSGSVEAANRTLVTTRMKRSGQRWSRHGGQGVLTFRSLAKSGRFDRAWARLARSWQPWRPPARGEAANDNRELALAA